MEKLTYKQMGTLACIIGKEYLEKYNSDYKFSPFLFHEFCAFVTFKLEGTISAKIEYINNAKGIEGFTDNTRKLAIVFINEFYKYDTGEEQIYQLLTTCFHELRHCIQDKFDKYSYEYFLREIELLYIKKDYNDYKVRHNLYSFEIGANLFAASETKKYLMEHSPLIYNKYKDRLEEYASNSMAEYYAYDPLRVLSPLMDEMIEKKERIDKPVFKIFFNEDCELKPIEELVKDDDFTLLDKRIVYYMIYAYYSKHGPSRRVSDLEFQLLEEANDYIEKVCLNRVDSICKFLDKKLLKKV